MNLYESIATELKAKYDEAYNNYNQYMKDAQKLLNALKDICADDKYSYVYSGPSGDSRNGNKYALFRPSAADENFQDAYKNFIHDKYPNIIVSADEHKVDNALWKSLTNDIKSKAKDLSMEVNVSKPKKLNDPYRDDYIGLEIEITSFTGNAKYRRTTKAFW